MELKNIQEIIDKKAKDRLQKDINTLYAYIDGNRLIKDVIVTNEIGKKDTLIRHLSWDSDNRIKKQIKEKWLPIYIAEESATFIEKVEGIQGQINDLMQHNNY